MWEPSAYNLVHGIVYRAGQLAARVATRQGMRLDLDWVGSVLTLGMSDELDRLGVKRCVAAGMFHMSTRTHRRQLNKVRTNQQAGVSLWSTLLRKLSSPSTLEALVQGFPAGMEGQLIALLRDMQSAKWLELRGHHYIYTPHQESWTLVMLRQYVELSLRCGHELDAQGLHTLTRCSMQECLDVLDACNPLRPATSARVKESRSQDLIMARVFEQLFMSMEDQDAHLSYHVLTIVDDEFQQGLIQELEATHERSAHLFDKLGRHVTGHGEPHESSRRAHWVLFHRVQA